MEINCWIKAFLKNGSGEFVGVVDRSFLQARLEVLIGSTVTRPGETGAPNCILRAIYLLPCTFSEFIGNPMNMQKTVQYHVPTLCVVMKWVDA